MLPTKLNTVLRFDDGRIGTICYNCLDGVGGIWGIHTFQDKDNLPAPDWIAKATVPSSLEGFDVEAIGGTPRWDDIDPIRLINDHYALLEHAEAMAEAGQAFLEFVAIEGDTVTRGQYIKYQVAAISGTEKALSAYRKWKEGQDES